ncbi:hypothetical protein NKG94_06670 [Micromonospora sp. M12]
MTGGWLLPLSLGAAIVSTVAVGGWSVWQRPGCAALPGRGHPRRGRGRAGVGRHLRRCVQRRAGAVGAGGAAAAVARPVLPYERWQLWLTGAATLLALLLLANLIRSRYGRTFRAVRDDEVAARLAGIHVARTQVLAFVVSAATAGLGGALLAVLAQSVSPGRSR